MASFNLADYATVNERIIQFYDKYPQGSLQSEIVQIDEKYVVVKAFAFRDREDSTPSIGHAEEKRDSSYINKTSALENCETSAVGRALAMLGFDVKKSVASREEVANAVAQQEAAKKGKKKQPPKEPEPLKWECGEDEQENIAFYLVEKEIDATDFFSWVLRDKIAKGEIPGPIVTEKFADYLIKDNGLDEQIAKFQAVREAA